MRRSMIVMSVFMLLAVAMPAVAVEPSDMIKGTMKIDFGSKRVDDAGKAQPDTYVWKLLVTDKLYFDGKITRTPDKKKPKWSILTYNISTALLIDPNRPPTDRSNLRQLGEMVGGVAISDSNVFDYRAGSVRFVSKRVGDIPEFTSKASGVARGKPARPSTYSKLLNPKLTFEQWKQGRKSIKIISDYDEMKYELTMPAGPFLIYPETMVNGSLYYDRETSTWFAKNLSATYSDPVTNKQTTDKITGAKSCLVTGGRKKSASTPFLITVTRWAGTPWRLMSTACRAALLHRRWWARGHSRLSCWLRGAPPPRQLPTMRGPRASRPQRRPQILGTTVKGSNTSMGLACRRRQRLARAPGPTRCRRESHVLRQSPSGWSGRRCRAGPTPWPWGHNAP